METQEQKTTIAQWLAPECKALNTLLDIGCGHAKYLFEFNKLGFKKIIGVDKKQFEINPVGNYISYLRETLNIKSHEALKINYSDESWFKFFICDFNKYLDNFPKERYSLIICRNVLHFYTDEEKYQIIDKLYNRLEPNGLLFIELNKSTNPREIDPTRSKHIAGNTYEGFTDLTRTLRHLADETDFKNQTEKYNPQPHLYFSNESIIKTVLKF